MSIRYIMGALFSIPLIPLLYFQGKKIRKEVPQLPEASDLEGSTSTDYKDVLKMLAIGESTIAGVGVQSHYDGFVGVFAETLSQLTNKKIDWKVYAKSGYTAARMYNKLLKHITEKEVDLIVLGIGGNDAFTLNTPWKWKADCKRLIKSLQDRFPNAQIVIPNMPPIKEFPAFTSQIHFVVGNLVEILGVELNALVSKYQNVHYYNDIITLDAWMKKYNIDLPKKAFFSDGVHPSQITYETWAKDFAAFVYKKLK